MTVMVTTTTTTCQMATVTRRLWMHHQRPLRRLWDSLQREQRPHALRCPSMLPRSEIRCLSETADGEGIYVITTPLFYVNAAPHMGSAYPTIAADVMARFQRMQGRKVWFLTGTDEHGEKIAAAAAARGISPQMHCDEIVVLYKHLWEQLNIEYDRFVRTTSPEHERFVLEVVDRVWENGDIYLDQYEGYYCVDCEEYKDADQMDASHNCLIHQKPCIYRQEENYFFRLSKYQKQIEALIEERPEFIQPTGRRNEVMGWVRQGLRDFSISRLAVKWGIPMTQDPRHTIYVWFDALNGYVSGMFPEGQEPSLQRAEAMGWPARVHLIGKDILRFHAVYWPAMLMSAGLPVSQQVFGHGFLTKDGMKMGKSLGNVLEPNTLVSAYGADAVRYFFMKEIALGQDGDFSEPRFREVINAAFANDIGNLLNRTLGLLKKNCGGVIGVASESMPPEHPLRSLVEQSVPRIAAAYEAFRFTVACDIILAIASRGNRYLEETTPWTYLKKGTESEKGDAVGVLISVLETVRIVGVLLSPIAPSLCRRIYLQLGFALSDVAALDWRREVVWGRLPKGQQTADPDPVFKRLEGEPVVDVAPSVAV